MIYNIQNNDEVIFPNESGEIPKQKTDIQEERFEKAIYHADFSTGKEMQEDNTRIDNADMPSYDVLESKDIGSGLWLFRSGL